MRNRDTRESKRRTGWSLAVAALGTFLWLGTTAASAQADSNFERGFEDQMGRILAYEAVNLGKAVLFQGVVHPIAHNAQPRHGGYGNDYGYDAGHHGYRQPPKRYVHRPYRRVPVSTHDYGPRPYKFKGHGYGHSKHGPKHHGKHKNHGNHGGHRGGHGPSCGHH